jgi:hypothetical protein
MAGGGSSCLPISIVWVTLLLTAFAGGLVSPAASQSPSQTKSAAAVHRSAKCQHPADPLRRHAECIDEDFDWDETLAGAWNGVRGRLREVGITPTMSYTGALQTNASGGPHQVWSYAGLLAWASLSILKECSRSQECRSTWEHRGVPGAICLDS